MDVWVLIEYSDESVIGVFRKLGSVKKHVEGNYDTVNRNGSIYYLSDSQDPDNGYDGIIYQIEKLRLRP